MHACISGAQYTLKPSSLLFVNKGQGKYDEWRMKETQWLVEWCNVARNLLQTFSVFSFSNTTSRCTPFRHKRNFCKIRVGCEHIQLLCCRECRILIHEISKEGKNRKKYSCTLHCFPLYVFCLGKRTNIHIYIIPHTSSALDFPPEMRVRHGIANAAHKCSPFVESSSEV